MANKLKKQRQELENQILEQELQRSLVSNEDDLKMMEMMLREQALQNDSNQFDRSIQFDQQRTRDAQAMALFQTILQQGAANGMQLDPASQQALFGQLFPNMQQLPPLNYLSAYGDLGGTGMLEDPTQQVPRTDRITQDLMLELQ